MAKKARMGKGKKHIKGPSKRTEEDDKRFEESFVGQQFWGCLSFPKCRYMENVKKN